MLASDSSIGFLCYFFFIYNIIIVIILCLPLQFSETYFGIQLFSRRRRSAFSLLSNATPIGVYKMQIADCTQAVLDCRTSTD